MSKYLISSVDTYRVDTESEAKALIEEAKHDNNYILTKSSQELKEVKAKGEVIDQYYKVTLTRSFTNIKEPDRQVEISFEEI
jgi:hypothetical protein